MDEVCLAGWITVVVCPVVVAPPSSIVNVQRPPEETKRREESASIPIRLFWFVLVVVLAVFVFSYLLFVLVESRETRDESRETRDERRKPRETRDERDLHPSDSFVLCWLCWLSLFYLICYLSWWRAERREAGDERREESASIRIRLFCFVLVVLAVFVLSYLLFFLVESRETKSERRETRDERRETRDESREVRGERRETRDERRETRGICIHPNRTLNLNPIWISMSILITIYNLNLNLNCNRNMFLLHQLANPHYLGRAVLTSDALMKFNPLAQSVFACCAVLNFIFKAASSSSSSVYRSFHFLEMDNVYTWANPPTPCHTCWLAHFLHLSFC